MLLVVLLWLIYLHATLLPPLNECFALFGFCHVLVVRVHLVIVVTHCPAFVLPPQCVLLICNPSVYLCMYLCMWFNHWLSAL